MAHNFAVPRLPLEVVDDPGLRERQFLPQGCRKLLPTDLALMTASAEPVAPGTLGVLEDHLEWLVVAADTVILIIPAQLGAQCLLLLIDILMAVLATPLPDRFNKASQTFPYGFPLDNPVTPA